MPADVRLGRLAAQYGLAGTRSPGQEPPDRRLGAAQFLGERGDRAASVGTECEGEATYVLGEQSGILAGHRPP
ncbi:hypothetical protein ACFU98_16745 [Streptomyces sp. NPDC057575]|uniref:hypothetical protein n=1 Tax=unclassified Streptomyces TaxID=2593676 RepID=UPI0036CE2202